MSPSSGLGHKVVKARMKIVDKRDGIAKFMRTDSEGVAVDSELVKSSWDFSNRKFKAFANGQEVLATFRISANGRRFLLNVRTSVGDEAVEEVAEEMLPPKIEVVDGFYYPPSVKRVFTTADKVAKKEGMTTILMVGPSGYGKTTFPRKFAEKTGRNCVRVNCAAIRDPEEWLGFREAKDGSTTFEPTDFARALQQGHSVIILDEINRLEPWLHNTLFPLLDDDKSTVIHNKRFDVADDTIFVLTLNQGLQFTGTFELDQAFVNRVHMTIHVGPPPEEHEMIVLEQREGVNKSIARGIVSMAEKIRKIVERGEADVDCSTRATLRIARLTKYGADLRSAFHDVIEAATPDPDVRKRLSDALNSELGMFNETRGWKADDNVFDN